MRIFPVVLALALVFAPQGFAQTEPGASPGVRTTIVPGAPPKAIPTPPGIVKVRRGDVSLDFPNAEAAVAAKAILGDLLGLQFTVPPGLHTTVSVVTQRPIARADVLAFFEAALANSGLAMTVRDGVYAILPVAEAPAQAPVAASDQPGFATETVPLRFVDPEALRRLIDPVIPNVIVQADPTRHLVVIAGTAGQRRAAKDLIAQFDVDWLRNLSFALYVPQRTDARLLVPELDKLINADTAPTKGLVRLIAMDRINGVLAISTQAQYLEDVRRWMEILDREGESSERRIFVYRVQNGRSADLAKVLASAFGATPRGGAGPRSSALTHDDLTLAPPGPSAPNVSSGPGQPAAPAGTLPADTAGSGASDQAASPGAGSVNVDISTEGLHAKISSDETNNAVVVYATPHDYAIIEDALRKLDVTPSEVLIEAAIVEVTLTDQMQYGVQWSFAGAHTVGTLSQSSTTTLTSGAASALTPTFPGLSILYTNGNSIQANLNALENLTKIKVVSAPKLMVLNNQTASLQVGDQVPVIAASALSTVGTNAPLINEIDYHDTGIILKITPRVNSSGLVLLDVAQEVSDVVPNTVSDIDSPQFSTRRIATAIAVGDGEVVALGGLFSNSSTHSKAGIPYLSRIPVLGALFGQVNNNDQRTELIVLLRPRVVRGEGDAKGMTEEMRQKLQTLRQLLPTSGIP
ncbi:MAG TPA: type II secretion system secretin GspD [Caulobacteraceae bacterium]|jgi:general secretion pathway protein D|nr:type II secretion system secretin GspD [Caulobacteraceae bacterium]